MLPLLSHLHIRKDDKCRKQMMNQIKRMIYSHILRALGIFIPHMAEHAKLQECGQADAQCNFSKLCSWGASALELLKMKHEWSLLYGSLLELASPWSQLRWLLKVTDCKGHLPLFLLFLCPVFEKREDLFMKPFKMLFRVGPRLPAA